MSDFERVYTMTDYYDGPRGGIASFKGKPYVYASVFDSSQDEYSDVFELRLVDDATLQLVLEDWEIWLRWEDAHQAGVASLETHPALPADRARHDKITQILTARRRPGRSSDSSESGVPSNPRTRERWSRTLA